VQIKLFLFRFLVDKNQRQLGGFAPAAFDVLGHYKY